MEKSSFVLFFQSSRRRVSEIALPKVLGGIGAPNLHPSSSMVGLELLYSCLKYRSSVR